MNKYDIIHTIYPMPKASVDKLVENITEVAYPKSSLILEAGKTERNIFFVGKGIVRAYVEAKGKEITFWCRGSHSRFTEKLHRQRTRL